VPEPTSGEPTPITRRSLIEAAGALLLLAASSSAQTPASGRRNVFERDLPDLAFKGWSATAIEVSYQPGQASSAHKHPGLTFAYVLEGEVVSKVGDEPERTYKAGEMWMETPGQIHAVSRNASDSRPARLLALLLAEKGAQLSVPVK
jgi:quercetin dioxygenase-like cupin family protein